MTLRSLFTGVSGMQVHLQKMDVVGNNIANLNTVGFKKGMMTFKDFISQTLRISSSPTATLGGTNPQQVGLGVKVGAVTVDFAQGQLQRTGRNLDVAMEGNGFFVVKGSGGELDLHYTRAGAFDFDANGSIVDPGTGYQVQGWNAGLDAATGQLVINSNISPIENLKVQVGQTIPAKATTEVDFRGNLNEDNDLAIDPIEMEYTQNDVTRKFKINFQHSHPTKLFYSYSAEWTESAPSGFKIGDAVIDSNTGKAIAGILELNDDGTVKGHFINTDDPDVMNAQRTKYLDDLQTGSTIELKQVRTVEHGTRELDSTDADPSDMQGFWRVRFNSSTNPTIYTVEFSSDFNPGNPDAATWVSVPGRTAAGSATLTTASNVTITDESGSDLDDNNVAHGQLRILATDWSGESKFGDVVYFRTKRGTDNGIFDFPMEQPKDEDDHPTFRPSKPANLVETASGTLTNVFVNQTAQAAAATAPNLGDATASTGTQTQTIWRAVFGGTNGDGTTPASGAAGFIMVYSRDGGLTWREETNNVGIPAWTNSDLDGDGSPDDTVAAFRAGMTDARYALAVAAAAGHASAIGNAQRDISQDFTTALGEITLNSENWSGNQVQGDIDGDVVVGGTGDLYEWRVSYSRSTTLNRDFFTIEETQTQLQATPTVTTAGTLAISNVTVDGDALADAWTITFTAADTFTLSSTSLGAGLATGSVNSQFKAFGLTIESNFWSGTAVAADTVRFSTISGKIKSDFAVPSGNSSSEALTFTPNTNDTKFNIVDSGNPVKAKLKAQNEYQFAASVNVFDSLGEAHTMPFFFERISQNKWLWSVDDPTPADPNDVKLAGFGVITFDSEGKLDSSGSETFESEVGQEMTSANRPSSLLQVIFDPADDGGAPPPDEGAKTVEITPRFDDLVQFSAPNDGEISGQDGFGKGTLLEVNINLDGIVVGLFDNGQTQDLAQFAIANFTNPGGLLREGSTYFRTGGNSGDPIIGLARKAGRGTVVAGALEGSNVDLAVEFTEMIIVQRGFSANSRTIQTADQMLVELLGLKR